MTLNRKMRIAAAVARICVGTKGVCLEGYAEPRIAFERARTAVDTALKLDPKSAEAYAIRDGIRTVYEWDWDGAAADAKKSEEFGGGEYTEFAAAKIAYTPGDMPRARQLLESIIARNPVEPDAQIGMGYFVDLRSGRYSEAEVFIRRGSSPSRHKPHMGGICLV